ncbi:hypothetical protein E2C01_044583 [Portunus trituberculatus]|uniref:Uncharacterized protein n=1 Tax=Portunus trituberculatus TaxID=210409 RepID=A0A5B7G0F7_PORTR|nr:hypothetical protein [Portunus trituberculatus]
MKAKKKQMTKEKRAEEGTEHSTTTKRRASPHYVRRNHANCPYLRGMQAGSGPPLVTATPHCARGQYSTAVKGNCYSRGDNQKPRPCIASHISRQITNNV